MRKAAIFTLFLLATIAVHSQKSPIKFGDIPMDDMKMTIYPQDSSAAAVVLADFGMAYLTTVAGDDWVLMFERHMRIKVLTKEALDPGGLDIANQSIRVASAADQRLQNFKASTYNLEGGKIVESKVTKDNMFKEKINRWWDRMRFAFPNVKEGSVIELTFKIQSQGLAGFPDWEFQKANMPTRLSEYWAMFPTEFTFEKFLQGYVPMSGYEMKQMNFQQTEVNAHHWTARNVPAFREEPYMTCEDDYISRINLALSYYQTPTGPREVMGTWDRLAEVLNKSEAFGKAIEGSGFLKDQVATITAGMTEPLQKINAIADYVRKNVEWDGNDDYAADPLKKVLEKKKGTTGDINILLAAMLEKAGIDLDMILLSTRDHGFIRKQFPMESQFNYVVVRAYLPDKAIFIDATSKYLPLDVLPKKCLNGEGLIVSPKRKGWVDLNSKVKSRRVYTATFQLDANDELTGKLDVSRDGYYANEMRESYLTKGEEAYVKALKKNNWQVEKSEFQNVKEFDKSVKETYTMKIAEHAQGANDILYINPFVEPMFSENTFKSAMRVYPVDFNNLTDNTYMLKLTVPDGYTVDELPKSKAAALPGNAARYTYSASQTGNVINITRTLTINRTLFTQDEYPNLREFYNLIVAKEAETIVIKKKS